MLRRLLASLPAAALALARRPRFALGATALFAGTLFAVCVMVALFAAVVLRPLPFARPSELVAVRATVQRQQLERRAFSRPDFVDYQQQLQSASGIAGYSFLSATVRGVGAPRVTPGEIVDARYFQVLGVAPALGRAFTAEEAKEPAVLISDKLWRERFQADPAAVGRTISVDGNPCTVTGVMPAGFAGVTGGADIWLSFDAPGVLPASLLANRGNRWHEAIARLAPGTSIETLNRELATIGARLDAQYPDSNRAYSADALPLREELLGTQADAVAATAAGVALLLLITVLNLGGLGLVRANARTLEHAMRRCLGASPGRLFADTAAEGVLIGFVAGVVAIAPAYWLMPLLPDYVPLALPGFLSTALTPGVALAVLAIGVLGGFAAFTLGATIARGAQPVTLRAGARSTRQHASLRRGLIGGEIALGVALLAAALLLARSFAAVAALDPGYRVDGVAVLDFRLPSDRYDNAAGTAFARKLVALARETPGVTGASLGSDSPLGIESNANRVTSDRLEPESTRVYRHSVLPGFFAATGIALESGSDFPDNVASDGEQLTIVSAGLAKKLWPGEDAVGKRMHRGGAGSGAPWMRVVGVAKDSLWRGLPFQPTADPDFFVPLEQDPETSFSLVLQTRDEPHATARLVADRLRSLDPEVPVYAEQSMRERVRAATQIPRFLATLGLMFAGIALVLAALGVYAIAALDAGQRVREIAIRQAVGANLAALARLFIGEYGRIFGAAIALGLVALIPLARILESRLYGVPAADPWSIAGSAALFALALAFGIAAPLLRVLRVQPAELMRGE